MNKEILSTKRFRQLLLTFLFPEDTFLHACTKECNLLYKTIHSFVQKNELFCTREYKPSANELKHIPDVALKLVQIIILYIPKLCNFTVLMKKTRWISN